MLNFFLKKYTKTPSDRIEKNGPLLLTIYFSDYGTYGFLQHPAGMKRMFYNVLTPDIFLIILFSRTSKSLSMGVFVDGS